MSFKKSEDVVWQFIPRKQNRDFKGSDEYQMRRFVRRAIAQSDLTRAEKEITIAIANLWFHHRNGPEKIIRPGRKRLARQTKVTIKTVSRTFRALKSAGAITAIRNPRGGVKPTHYTVNLPALMALCGAKWVDEFLSGAYKSQAEIIQLGEGK